MTHILDKADIIAMRKADSIVFRHMNGKSQIECILRANDIDNPFEQKRVIIDCMFDYRDYGREAINKDQETIDYLLPKEQMIAFEMIHSSKYDAPFQTIVSLLKVGDILLLFWLRDAHRNQYMEKETLHGDRLDLQIRRDDKRLDFHLIQQSGCPDNTARMIQRGKERQWLGF